MSVRLPQRLSRITAHLAPNPLATRSAASSAASAMSESKKHKMGKDVEIYFGTMTFGWNQASSKVDANVAKDMTNKFLSSGGVQIDTARIYSGGDTEDILGKVMRDLDVANKSHVLATKAHPSQPGGLSKTGLRSQLSASLKALQVEKVDVFYLHQPDPENDLLESLECVQELINEGLISKYGMSNYSALEVERCCTICKERGWKLPSFYQGLYNPLNRLVEAELLPTLRKHSVSFVAYLVTQTSSNFNLNNRNRNESPTATATKIAANLSRTLAYIFWAHSPKLFGGNRNSNNSI
eukprot:TRINITY_DN11138_c0_g1_i1.p1 TRINITY_DN11138_c0_g1~~TRINITY_DN11138_c0_g1_i1.p1  ORF type:complete len:296 (-),score=24.78 TRINITY_DN11138_c0_g1_i1:51-938(-)